MRQPIVTKASFFSAFIVVASFASPSRADETCTVSGEPVMAAGVSLSDSAAGGTEIAHFTGAKVPITVLSVPESGGRALIETNGFRIKGFVRLRDLPTY